MRKYVTRIAIALVVISVMQAVFYLSKRRHAETNSDPLTHVIEQLKSPEMVVREEALKQLEDYSRKGLPSDEGSTVLKAAGGAFPPLKNEWQDAAAELVKAAAVAPQEEYIQIVSASFATYNARAKIEALALLAKMNERAAAETYVSLVKAHARGGSLTRLPTGTLDKNRRHTDILFPALIEVSDVSALRWDIYLLCLDYLEHGALQPASLEPYVDGILTDYRQYRDKLKPLQRREGVSWMWEESYQELRSNAGLLLDISGYLPGRAVAAELRDALSYEDPRLAFFAARSLMKAGVEVPAQTWLRIAASSETRNLLFDSLNANKHLDLFPKAYATQEALAESAMVDWLTYPTELATVPDEIELMKVVSEDVGGVDGILDFYLFRFRTREPHWAAKEGWMAGVAGPFRRADAPSTVSYGYTFSTFEHWDAKKPEEHVEQIKKILREWKENEGSTVTKRAIKSG